MQKPVHYDREILKEEIQEVYVDKVVERVVEVLKEVYVDKPVQRRIEVSSLTQSHGMLPRQFFTHLCLRRRLRATCIMLFVAKNPKIEDAIVSQVLKEVPTIRYVDRVVTREVPVVQVVERVVEVLKEVPIEVVKEVPVYVR